MSGCLQEHAVRLPTFLYHSHVSGLGVLISRRCRGLDQTPRAVWDRHVVSSRYGGLTTGQLPTVTSNPASPTMKQASLLVDSLVEMFTTTTKSGARSVSCCQPMFSGVLVSLRGLVANSRGRRG